MAATMTASKRMPAIMSGPTVADPEEAAATMTPAITSWPTVADPEEEAKAAAKYPTLATPTKRTPAIMSGPTIADPEKAAATMTPAITSWPTVSDPEEEAKMAAKYPTLDDFYKNRERVRGMVAADKYYYLYRVWCGSWQMLEDRGYEINVKEYEDISFDVFKDKYFKFKNNKRCPDREKLKIRIHKPKVIVTFPTRARLDTPTLPIPVAEFMNDGDEKLWRIIVVTDIRLTEVESIAKRLEDFYMVNYSRSVKTEVFASRVLHLNAARYGYNMRRYKKVTTEEQEELKLVKGKGHILIKEEEDSKWAGKRLKQNINPRQISPLSEDCILVSYFDLKKGEFLKSSQPRHLNAALKAKNDAYEAGDREGFKFIKEFFQRPDDFQVIYHHYV